MCDGAVAGFKYFDLRETSKVRINIKGKATGIVYVSTEEGGKPVAKIQVKSCKEQHGFAADVNGLGEKEALYFSYKGTGAFNFMSVSYTHLDVYKRQAGRARQKRCDPGRGMCLL